MTWASCANDAHATLIVPHDEISPRCTTWAIPRFRVNAAGQVAGQFIAPGGENHAFLYSDGKVSDLTAPSPGYSFAFGMNALGQVVGGSGVKRNDCLPFIYDHGSMKRLGTLGGSNAWAFAINDAGQVVGASLTARGVTHAFHYTSDAGMKNLGAAAQRPTVGPSISTTPG